MRVLTVAILLLLAAPAAAQDVGTEVNRACKSFKKQLAKVPEPDGGKGVRRYARKVVRLSERLAVRFEEIAAPRKLAPEALVKLINTFRRQIVLFDRQLDAFIDDDQPRVRAIGRRFNRLDKRSDRLALKLGAPACLSDNG